MIKNKTRKTVICSNKKILKSIFSKAKGLMFSKKKNDLGLIFLFGKPMRIDLHMFFVFFPIDLLFLENKKVVEIKENFRPFTFYYSAKKADTVIEVPVGTIKKSKTKVGDMIEY